MHATTNQPTAAHHASPTWRISSTKVFKINIYHYIQSTRLHRTPSKTCDIVIILDFTIVDYKGCMFSKFVKHTHSPCWFLEPTFLVFFHVWPITHLQLTVLEALTCSHINNLRCKLPFPTDDCCSIVRFIPSRHSILFHIGVAAKICTITLSIRKADRSSVSGHIWPSKTIFFFGSVEKKFFLLSLKSICCSCRPSWSYWCSLLIVHTSNPALPLSLIHNNVKPVKAMFIIATVSSILLWVHQCPQLPTPSTEVKAIVVLCTKVVTKLVA